MPVTELAKRAGVSSPSVVWFCRSLGYEGLSDFKLKLAASLNAGVPFIHQSVKAGDSGETLIQKVLDNAIHTLRTFRNTAPAKPIDKATQLLAKTIAKKGRLVFYGVGNSGFVALDAEHKFFRMGCTAHAYSDGHLQIMAASMLNKGDCLIIISNSGRSQDLLDATQIARAAGASTIAITASGSPLAQAGLVALSLALAPELAVRTQYALVPREWHQPLVQGMVLVQAENQAAKAFVDFMSTASARAVLKRYGYDEVREQ
ncbi:RpiR family transcriptional regulator [methanotrophic bacterial endosymbiont of Bathymodiolus sp.]|nr:RpiR family transcriptional regulator [methanotrophic bacterial endosymbiont of Bathymodiolus sp.]